jgi:hypothetical protein
MRRRLGLVALLLAALDGCGKGDRLQTPLPTAPGGIRVASPAFAAGATIPRRYTCDGTGISPPLRWSGISGAAAGLALVVSDPDAPGGRFVHWTLYDLPPDLRALPAGAPELAGARQGRNSFGDEGWGAPCPPNGDRAHRYQFDLYWLRQPIKAPAGAEPDAVIEAITRAAGGHGRLVGRYARR